MGGRHYDSKLRYQAAADPLVFRRTARSIIDTREDDYAQPGGLGELFARHLIARYGQQLEERMKDHDAPYAHGHQAGLDWLWSDEGRAWLFAPADEANLDAWVDQVIAAQDRILGEDETGGQLAGPAHQAWADAIKETQWHKNNVGLCHLQQSGLPCPAAERFRLETS